MASESSTHHRLEEKYQTLRRRINAALEGMLTLPEPQTLYEPARYILSGKGKRVRPVLVMLGAEAIGGARAAQSGSVLNIALGIEVLHNFTLVHDDIMDSADLRHSRPTVHKKWDTNIAILTGDMMLAFAYQLLLRAKPKNLDKILAIFTESIITICEGQAFDKEFESKKRVSLDEYLMMISKKTGRLIAVALELGGLAAGATPAQAKALRVFGEHIGQAFQVQDDLLDIMGDEKFGKTVGGDVRDGKKTFLLIHALELARGDDRKLLQSIIDHNGISAARVPEVKRIYETCGVLAEARTLIEKNFKAAIKDAAKFPNPAGRDALIGYASMVMQRDF